MSPPGKRKGGEGGEGREGGHPHFLDVTTPPQGRYSVYGIFVNALSRFYWRNLNETCHIDRVPVGRIEKVFSRSVFKVKVIVNPLSAAMLKVTHVSYSVRVQICERPRQCIHFDSTVSQSVT